MFVPSDGIYQAALAEDPALIEYGVQQQILMATPTTLIGLLWAVHYGWRQELIAESAREIAESARELHRRLGRFVEPLAKVGRQLDSAIAAYNEAVGSFDARVVPQVRRIEQAGAASDREVLPPPPVETTRARGHGAAGSEPERVRPLRDRTPSRRCRAPAVGRGRHAELRCSARRGAPPASNGAQPRDQQVSATGTVAGSSSTNKNSRSKPSASSAGEHSPRPAASDRPAVTASSAPSTPATNRSP